MFDIRASGVLLPVFSLPGEYGIGTFGKSAYDFVDFLRDSGQRYWQILPLCPTGYGNSPYQSICSFAGNPFFLDSVLLCRDGFLSPRFAEERIKNSGRVNYDFLEKSQRAFCEDIYICSLKNLPDDYESFCNKNAFWLDDYCLFFALREYFGGKPFYEWYTGLKMHQPDALSLFSERLEKEINTQKIIQYHFYSQWSRLKKYANDNGVLIIGDVPIYVSADSSDVWAHSDEFELLPNRVPREVAGCPPDYFSPDGQLWGNPVYDWNTQRDSNYKWWKSRFAHNFSLYDGVRIDHFRGFESYYCIKYGSKNAKHGVWRKGPGKSFFDEIKKDFPTDRIIAENLGFLTPAVDDLLEYCGFPGMKVLQFAFDSGEDNLLYNPHSYPKNSVVYTGTHDNDTIIGWADHAPKEDVALATNTLDAEDNDALAENMMMSAMDSESDTCILTMQDLLHLGSEARINTPSTVGNNWQWRMKSNQINSSLSHHLLDMTRLSGRAIL